MSKLKKEFLGQLTYSKILNGMVEINESTELALMLEGREELFIQTEKKPLKEVSQSKAKRKKRTDLNKS
jgi:hypothetical protein